jgi:hypothetical protein
MELAMTASFGMLLLLEAVWFVRKYRENKRRARFQIIRMVIIRRMGDDK